MDEGDRLFLLDYQIYLSLDRAYVRAKQTISQKLAEEGEAAKAKKASKDLMLSYYHGFAGALEKKKFDSLPECCSWDHAIELIPDAKPVNCKIYLLSLEEQRQLDAILEEKFHFGWIHPSKSSIASLFFFVKKKNGSLWPTQDF